MALVSNQVAYTSMQRRVYEVDTTSNALTSLLGSETSTFPAHSLASYTTKVGWGDGPAASGEVISTYSVPVYYLDDAQTTSFVGVAAAPQPPAESCVGTLSQSCELSAWSGWGACEAPGTQSRTRTVVVAPLGSGAPCGALSESRACVVPVNCVVSQWSAYGACSEVCGSGTQQRTRTVTTQPSSTGTACPALSEDRACDAGSCDCVVSQWSDYGACSADCGPGQRMRTRTVTTPARRNAPACPALNQTEACDAGACEVPAEAVVVVVQIQGITLAVFQTPQRRSEYIQSVAASLNVDPALVVILEVKEVTVARRRRLAMTPGRELAGTALQIKTAIKKKVSVAALSEPAFTADLEQRTGLTGLSTSVVSVAGETTTTAPPGGLGVGLLVLIIVGSLAVVVTIGVVVYCCKCRDRSAGKRPASNSSGSRSSSRMQSSSKKAPTKSTEMRVVDVTNPLNAHDADASARRASVITLPQASAPPKQGRKTAHAPTAS